MWAKFKTGDCVFEREILTENELEALWEALTEWRRTLCRLQKQPVESMLYLKLYHRHCAVYHYKGDRWWVRAD